MHERRGKYMPLTVFMTKFSKFEQRTSASAAVIGHLHSHTQHNDEVKKGYNEQLSALRACIHQTCGLMFCIITVFIEPSSQHLMHKMSLIFLRKDKCGQDFIQNEKVLRDFV
ncbi:hypothetical protein AB4K20DRAFT_1866291 [Rhizopus microsporus]